MFFFLISTEAGECYSHVLVTRMSSCVNCPPTGLPWSLASDFSYRDTGEFESLVLSASLLKRLEFHTVTAETGLGCRKVEGSHGSLPVCVSCILWNDRTHRASFLEALLHFSVMDPAVPRLCPASDSSVYLCEKRGL